MKLHLDDNDLGTCVSCGLCLPHCPTFRVTGEEALSPRGRISAMRAVHFDDAPVSDDFVHFMETCVQCRGCEPACPSGVPFGQLMEGTRDTLAAHERMTPWWQRLGLSRARPPSAVAGRLDLARGCPTAATGAEATRVCPGLPCAAARRRVPTGSDTWLFTGCVMDAWQRETHRNTAKVLTALGVTYHHARARWRRAAARCMFMPGLTDEAKRLAERVMRSMPGNAPIVVNSAGCGAALKDYGHLVGTREAKAFSARVRDASEFVAPLVDRLPVRRRLGAGHRAGSVPSAPRAARPPAGANRAGCGRRRRRARRRGPVLRRRRRVLDACSRSSPGRSANESWQRSSAPARRSSPAPTRAARFHLAAAGVNVKHPMDLVAEAL